MDRVSEICESLFRGQSFPCHKTTNHDDDEECAVGINQDNEVQCAGAEIFLASQGMSTQMSRIAGRWGVNSYGLGYRRDSSPGHDPSIEVDWPTMEDVEYRWAYCRTQSITVNSGHLLICDDTYVCSDPLNTPQDPWVSTRWLWATNNNAPGAFVWKWLPRYGSDSGQSPMRGAFLSLPLYFPVVIFAAYPIYRCLPIHRRRRRKKLGLCVKCGYDLRASKDRCPECGEEFETA